ncbi:MAG: flippase-like domain-containing protein [Reichenbachiella sp.]
MQFTQLFSQTKQDRTSRVRLAFGWNVSLFVLSVTGYKLITSSQYDTFVNNGLDFNYWYLALVILLLPVNVFFESIKWKVLCASFDDKGYWYYFKLILSGRSTNVITPFGIGDAALRVATVDSEHRVKSIVSLGISRVTQFVPAAVGGGISSWILIAQGVEIGLFELHGGLLALLVGGGIVGLVFFLKKLKANYGFYLVHLDYRLVILSSVLSIVRYLVFTSQFYLVFLACGVEGEIWVLLSGIFWIFFIKTIVPNLTVLGDLAKREVSAMLFFSVFMIDIELVAISNLVIWLINMVLPAIIGVLFIPNLTQAVK